MSKTKHRESSGRPAAAAALIVVDVQRDFCAGGSLEAPGSDRILPAVNRHIGEAQALGLPVYASRDWHPPVTTHFAAFGGEWPPHCVMDTAGAEFHPDLALPSDAIVVSKGVDPERPGYSAFDGTTPDGTSLVRDLRARGIHHLYIAGMTTEYCVRQTVLDARQAGLRVSVLADAIAALDQHPGDADRALGDMRNAGAEVTHVISR
jgi:nicotinamidase/pyrazinamidase